MKTSVLHIVLSLETGGLENGIVNLVNLADNSRFQVDVLCLRADGELVQRITNKNCSVFFDNNPDSSISTAVSKINKICKARRYDILHTHGWATMLPAFISRLGRRDSYLINGEHGTVYINSFLQKQVQRLLFYRMDLNLTVSVDLARKLSRLFKIPESRFRPIINGVDAERFKFDPASKTRIRQELGITDKDFVVGSVGRLVNVKNYPCLLRAFGSFSVDKENVKLLLVGEGDERPVLEKMITDLALEDRVILAGRRDDIPAVLSTMDVFVLPSFREGLSNTLLEAMSTGLPTLASDVGGNPELIVPGSVGELFEVDNDVELSGYLHQWYSDRKLLEEMAVNARRQVESDFTVSAMVANYEATYLDVTGKRNAY